MPVFICLDYGKDQRIAVLTESINHSIVPLRPRPQVRGQEDVRQSPSLRGEKERGNAWCRNQIFELCQDFFRRKSSTSPARGRYCVHEDKWLAEVVPAQGRTPRCSDKLKRQEQCVQSSSLRARSGSFWGLSSSSKFHLDPSSSSRSFLPVI